MTAWGTLELTADYGPTVGTGHVRRLLALASEWRCGGGTSVLRTPVPLSPALHTAAMQAGVFEPPSADPGWTILDGYTAPIPPPGTTPLMIIDDFRQRRTHGSEPVLDQNLGATRELYPEAEDALVGPRFALLRREFAEARGTMETQDRVRRVVIALGGLPDRTLLETVRSIVRSTLVDADVDVLDGRRADVARVFAEASLAVSAAGTTSWELLCMGVPTVLLTVSDNQVAVREHLIESQVCWAATTESLAGVLRMASKDAAERDRRSARGRRLVDGLGARRVVADLRSRHLRLRTPTADDGDRLLRWANDPVTRANSFSSAVIEWSEHSAWLNARMTDPDSLVLIAGLGEADIGQVRFSRGPERVETSLVLAPEARGQGLASAVIRAGVRRARVAWGPVVVTARIKPSNLASRRAFQVAGFEPVSSGAPEHQELWLEDRP